MMACLRRAHIIVVLCYAAEGVARKSSAAVARGLKSARDDKKIEGSFGTAEAVPLQSVEGLLAAPLNEAVLRVSTDYYFGRGSETVLPVAAEVRAASRISVAIRLVWSEVRGSG